MGACHRNSFPETHQFRQHLRPGNDRYALFARGRQLRIVAGDGARINDNVAAVNTFLLVFKPDLNPHIGKTLRRRPRVKVRA